MAVFGAAVGHRDLFPRQAGERGAQRGLVGLDGQEVVATGVDDCLGSVTPAVQGLGGDERVGDVEYAQKGSP